MLKAENFKPEDRAFIPLRKFVFTKSHLKHTFLYRSKHHQRALLHAKVQKSVPYIKNLLFSLTSKRSEEVPFFIVANQPCKAYASNPGFL